jgi:hypothetical protein
VRKSALPCLVLLVVPATLAACATDLGPCDDAAARAVYYDDEGTPSYAGQALLRVGCGNGSYCHSPDATGAGRFGAPHDVNVVMLVPPGTSAASFARAHRSVVDHDTAIYDAVEAGMMPPYDASWATTVYDGLPRYRDGAGARLPDVDSAEGLRMLRNWLACETSFRW